MSFVTRAMPGVPEPVAFGAAYRTVWRWHFYAGLYCLPFIVVLSLSGAVYLFKPQIDAFLDRRFDHLALLERVKPLDAQVAAALKANPGSRLKALQYREDPSDAARVILMTSEGRELRALVRPDTLEVVETQAQKSRLTQIVHDLHGELLIGEPGAIAVELAGAWAIVMVITGLYLWWPRGLGLAGVLYPRLSAGGRTLLRDLHAVTGFWMSFFALFFLLTALPWTRVWGEDFKAFRGFIGARQAKQDWEKSPEIKQDWTTGPASERAQRLQAYREAPPAQDEHAEHRMSGGVHHEHAATPVGFDRLAALAAELNLADPVYIKPPSPNRPNWVVKSETQNRTLGATIEYDPSSFAKVKEETFWDRAVVDRVVGIGVAAHEGQLFGWFNQLLGLLTAIGYMTLVVTSFLMWWRRRPIGSLGAPPALVEPPRLAPFVIGVVVLLGLFLPTLGVSLLGVLAFEQIVRRLAPRAGRWLGLTPEKRQIAADAI